MLASQNTIPNSESNSDQMSLVEDQDRQKILSKSILGTISKIIDSIECITEERESIMEIGCYLMRTSLVIKELKTSQNIPPSATKILETVAGSVNLTKELIEKCCTTANPSPIDRSIIEQLEGMIQDIGLSLSLIPSSTFGDEEYVQIAVRSISKEMQNAHFEIVQNQFQDPKLDFTSLKIETDLYPVEAEIPCDSPCSPDKPQAKEYYEEMSYIAPQCSNSPGTRSMTTLPQVADYLNPIYETFFCPLTKKIMEYPVTVSSGVTYERSAIIEWLNKSQDSSEEVLCPVTGKKLTTRVLNTNVALKTTIEAWKERHETTRIKVARAALSSGNSDSMILEALKELQKICGRNISHRAHVLNTGMLPVLGQCLESHDENVKCATLELLQLLTERDDDGKEMVVKSKIITTTVKMLSSKYLPERHLTLSFLLQLSVSESLCEKIGSVTGLILMLITMKFKHSYDALSSEKASKILKNLEKSPKNIKCMAGNGFLEPLINHLIEGSEEVQMEMGSYLGEIVLGHDTKIYVAERASPTLIRMMHSANALAKKAAFKALIQISSYHPNSRTLVEAGIVPILLEEMFMRRIDTEFGSSMQDSSAILANILDSGISLETLEVNNNSHTLGSTYIVYRLVQLLKNSNSVRLNINLINILLCLMKSSKAASVIVSVVKETDTSYTLIGLINSPQEDLGTTSIKLLITLMPYMGDIIADRLCKTRGQPESLLKYPTDAHRITEIHAVSAHFLAKLPSDNLPLNLALLHKNAVPTVIQTINEIQQNGTRTSRFANSYLEGLVGILVRFTATLHEPQMLELAKKHNFKIVFTELLMRASSDEVQKLSAVGLGNLSAESPNLSKPPDTERTKTMKFPKFLSVKSFKKRGVIQVCAVHRGVCSSQTTFCLLDGKAIERLLSCLDHENVQVVEAALSAICTLLDDKVDLDRSVTVLREVHTIKYVLNVMKEHKEESVLQKTFWIIEKFLKSDYKSALYISQDRLLTSTLVTALQHGDANTRQIAEKILKHLNKMPKFSTKF